MTVTPRKHLGKIGHDLLKEQEQELQVSPAGKKRRMKNSVNYFNLGIQCQPEIRENCNANVMGVSGVSHALSKIQVLTK